MADTDALRSELETERDQLAEQVATIDPLSKKGDAFDENFADSGQVAAEQGENRVLYDQLKKELDDVEAALSRLDDGSYGTCQECGNAIGEARLEAMPAARYCIDHA